MGLMMSSGDAVKKVAFLDPSFGHLGKVSEKFFDFNRFHGNGEKHHFYRELQRPIIKLDQLHLKPSQ
jgi:hypothetical protein